MHEEFEECTFVDWEPVQFFEVRVMWVQGGKLRVSLAADFCTVWSLLEWCSYTAELGAALW